MVPGIFATVALPAYAANAAAPGITSHAHSAAPKTLVERIRTQSQTVRVTTAVAAPAVVRDEVHATSMASWKKKQAAAVVSAGLVGASLASTLANPPYPHFSLSQVVAVAERYTGTPYVYGGASPAGFDCSGFTQFVYAQFGVALPHSAAAQGAMGTRISVADAKPGDVVVIDGGSHVGIYLGGGRMIDAPMPGRTVGNHAIWTSAYYIVRFGI